MSYDKRSIINLTPLEHIRKLPSGYITEGLNGIYHILKEIIDNSIDEVQLKGKNGLIDVIIFINKERNGLQFAVIDNGRGIPKEELINVFSNTLTSGKFTSKDYTFSTGSYGVGSSVTLALSKFFRAISFNGNVVADATIHHSNIPEEPIYSPNVNNNVGTIVTFEPDDQIFNNIDQFIEDHNVIYNYFYTLSLFGKYRIRMFTIFDKLPEIVRQADTQAFIQYLMNITDIEIPSYDSLKFNKEEYVNGFFGISKSWDKRFSIIGKNDEDTLRVEGDLLISLSNTFSGNTKLTLVNDILFTNNSIHVTLLYQYIKDRIANYIPEKRVRTFFLENYKLPIWLVLDIKYSGAVFSGLAKVAFNDQSFQPKYISVLNNIFDEDTILQIFNTISNHISLQYDKFSNNDFRQTNAMKGLLQRLNRPKKFNDCSTTNRSTAELFLVEGDSAKNDQDRNSSFQASYTLGGKPFNGLTAPNKIEDSLYLLKKNALFQDIIRIINITPGSNNLSNLNFHKIFIMADADTHGYHITNIVIGNLYLLCPALIEQGHMYVVMPPLYSLRTKNGQAVYFNNAQELNVTLAYHVYYDLMEIELESSVHKNILSQEEFVVFCDMVMRIGDELKRLSVEYAIPPIIIEQLALMTNYLNINKPNVKAMEALLGCDIRHVPSGNLLIISIGSEDIIVPLNQISELIYNRILPLYREFYYGKNRIFITTKKTDSLKRSPTTIIQLCDIFDMLNKPFTIKRYKGLGSTPSKDKATICTNPETRRVFQISSIGDVNRVFDMLGSDPSERKKLMDGHSI